jgi:glycosyltransferase involved in cell wall biosynthesis
MKICILTPRFPFPEQAGDVLRINNISKYLKSIGHTIILVTYYTGHDKEKYHGMVEQLYDKIYYVKRRSIKSLVYSFFALIFNKPIQIGYYFSIKYLFVLKKIEHIEKPDLYIVQLLRMVPYTNILNLNEKTIVDIADALSKTYEKVDIYRGLSLKKIIYNIEKERIEKYENFIIKKYKKCVLNTLSDKEFLDNQKSLAVHPMGVQCVEDFVVNYSINKIVFVGNMRTLQNQDAVYYFIKDIFPIIKRTIPRAVFYIIGAEPPFSIKKMADGENIVVSGFVESVEEEIKDAAVAVAPVRIAAGIQNKVLVSMACGIPVVLTSLISVGIEGLVPGKNCIISDTKEEIANSVISLMTNMESRKEIGKAGYELVKTEYSWTKQLEGYEEGVV